MRRALPPGPKTIALREGTHYLSETLALGPRDARLTLRNYPGEAATLSGGVPLDVAPSAWRDATAECGAGCWKASLPTVASVPGLRVDGVREIRARYPNFDPELDAVIARALSIHPQDRWEDMRTFAYALSMATGIACGGACSGGMTVLSPGLEVSSMSQALGEGSSFVTLMEQDSLAEEKPDGSERSAPGIPLSSQCVSPSGAGEQTIDDADREALKHHECRRGRRPAAARARLEEGEQHGVPVDAAVPEPPFVAPVAEGVGGDVEHRGGVLLHDVEDRGVLDEAGLDRLGDRALRLGRDVDAGPILRSAIAALAVEGGRVVGGEKDRQQVVERDHLRIEGDLDDLRVARTPGAHLAVGRVDDVAVGVAGDDARHALERL